MRYKSEDYSTSRKYQLVCIFNKMANIFSIASPIWWGYCHLGLKSYHNQLVLINLTQLKIA
jgi:hypothetical protein